MRRNEGLVTEDRLKEIEQHTADEYTGFATAQHIHELIAEVRRLRAVIRDDSTPARVTEDCQSYGHDPRYCQHCSSMLDGAEAYQSMLLKAL